MFQLYKKRDFGAFISDTIAFFRIYWKNFFSNYTVIAGGMIAILCILFFFLFRDLFSSIFNLSNQGLGSNFDYYFTENIPLFVVLILVAFVVSFLLSLVSMSYPIAYMQLIEESEDGKQTFSSSEIFTQIKQYGPRLIKFMLLSIVTVLPVVILASVLSVFLMFLIIGFFLLILLIPAMMVIYTQALFVYLRSDEGFFESLKTAWKILFSKKFWPIIGSTVVVYFIVSTLQGMVTMVPYLIIIFGMYLGASDSANESSLALLISGLYVVSIALSYFLINISMVNQGMIYYAFMEDKHHAQAFSEIDLIGQNAE